MFGQNNNQDQQQWQQTNNDFNQQGVPSAPVPAPDGSPGGNNDQPFNNGFVQPPAPAQQTDTVSAAANGAAAPALPANGTVSNDDLLQIKQDALQQLSPLVGHLEQSPEEKFRTTMMMIQASDDRTLLQTAYELAKQITDEKTRAQALLDVVNEINYFTQQHHNS